MHDNLDNEEIFFDIFNKGWETKKSINSHIMNQDLLVQEKKLKKEYDIKGIKLCGAGGGGYFLIITKDIVEEGTLINIDNKDWDIFWNKCLLEVIVVATLCMKL